MGHDHDIPHAVLINVGDQCGSRIGKLRTNHARNHNGNHDRNNGDGDQQ